MESRTNVDESGQLTKDQLIQLVQMYGRFALTIDGLWFLGMERRYGIEAALEVDEEVWRQYGRAEAKMLKRFLALNDIPSLDDVCRIYLLTPIWGNLGARAKTRDGNCILSVTECHPQKARIRKNLGEFPCKKVGIAYFEGLLAELNPHARFRCAVCPPDPHTEDLWCEWEVWFEGMATVAGQD